MYKVKFSKTSKSINFSTLIININDYELDYSFDNYYDCYKRYEEIILDETKHSLGIDFTQISFRVRFYEGDKILKQYNSLNF